MDETIDELRSKLDEMRFDARVALPEAQERFRRAETALRHLLRFGERLMQSESMEERTIGCSICEGARIVAPVLAPSCVCAAALVKGHPHEPGCAHYTPASTDGEA